MVIVDLKTVPRHLKLLGQWHQQEWSYLNPGETLEMRYLRMQAYFNDELIPSTFVALQDGQVMGSAAFIESDMDTHPELTPWLASVYVHPDFRCKGVGSALVRHVMRIARENGFKQLYLFTPDKVSFYERLGWVRISDERYRQEQVNVMSATW